MNLRWNSLVAIALCVVILFTGEAWAGQQGMAAVAGASVQSDDVKSSDDQDETWIIKWKRDIDPSFKDTSVIVTDYPELNATVAYPMKGIKTEDWLKRWSAADSVQYLQSNGTYTIEATPDDPLINKQRYLEQIHAQEAWDIATENRSLIIAVVDTGVDLKHPDLQDNLVGGVNLLNPRKEPQDDNGHGTNVAGIIAAVGNNKTGISGILWKAKVMPIKALEADGSGKEDKLGEGIRYAVDHGAKIVVLSLGLYRYSPFMRDIVQYAEDRGVLLVAATGNDGRDVKYPAAYPSVLAVGGASYKNTVEAKSNFGPEVDVVAPWNVYTTALGGGYEFNEGTSMAAPQAAAVAALIWKQYPEMKPYEVRNLIRQTADNIPTSGWNKYAGYGLLRVDRALKEVPKEDIYENNDSRDQAKAFPIDTMIATVLRGGKDQDWFYVDAPYDGTITYTFKERNGGPGSVQLTHYIGNQAQGKSYTVKMNDSVTVTVSKGRNYIQLRKADANSEESLYYQATGLFTIYRDKFADNDRMYKAYALTPRSQDLKGTFHSENQTGWFMLPINQPGTLSVKVTTDTARMDLALVLVQIDGKRIEVDQGGEGVAEYMVPVDVQPGKYYLQVRNVISGANGPSYPVTGEYTLSITYTTKYLDPNEPNDKPYQAVTMSMESTYVGVLDKQTDEDWFKFELKDESYVHLNLSHIPSNRTMYMGLYDEKLKQQYNGSNASAVTSIQLDRVLKPGTYYIKLTGNLSFQYQMYQLRVDAEKLVSGYKDVADHWARDAIVKLSDQKIINGYGNYSFLPDQGVTRAEATTMIVRAFKLTKTQTIAYTDLQSSHWAYASIAAATQAGIVSGYKDGSFAPNRLVTRAEMSVMLANAIGIKGADTGDSPFIDVPATYWALPQLKQMYKEKLLKGYSNGSFKPDNSASRAEFAAMLWTLMNARK